MRRAGAGRPTRRRGRSFERAFAEYGLPERIRSDNGGPFASTGLRRLSRLSVWWMRLGIRLERIALGHPEQNGSHEQFHAVLKAETARPPAANARAQQRRFTRFCAEYNDERPHEALAATARRRAAISPRRDRCRRRLPPVEYPGHLGDPTRLVRSAKSRGAAPAAVSLRRLGRRRGGLRRSRRGPLDRVLRHPRARSLRCTSSPYSTDWPRSRRGAPPATRWLRA